MRDTAVLINEFGEVGLDHHLIEHAEESVLLMDSGCLCCAIRGDLQGALRSLFSQRTRGEIPPFRRVAIETSGLADPTPIAYTILAEPVLQHHFRLGNVVTVIDAVNGAAQLERHPESVKQAAIADRFVLTKTAMADDGGRAIRAAVREINAAAPVFDLDADPLNPDALLTDDLYATGGKRREVAGWLDGFAADLRQRARPRSQPRGRVLLPPVRRADGLDGVRPVDEHAAQPARRARPARQGHAERRRRRRSGA